MKTAVEVTSTPRRRGPVYCSPRCGGGCTHEAYQRAVREAAALAAQLGDGWTARVWDNLGWHYSVYFGTDPIGISMSHNPGYYTLIVNGFGGGRSFHGRTPRAALNRARTEITKFANLVAASVAAFPKTQTH